MSAVGRTQTIGPTLTLPTNGVSVSPAKLLAKLAMLEGQPEKEKAFFQQVQQVGFFIIAVLEIGGDEGGLHMLQLNGLCAWLVSFALDREGIFLVKHDDGRFFFWTETVTQALQLAAQFSRACQLIPRWIARRKPELRMSGTVSGKVGIAHGGVLLMEGDCYGDPVNVASKLGEDLARVWEVLIVADVHAMACEAPVAKVAMSKVQFDMREAVISGVALKYGVVSSAALARLVDDPPLPLGSEALPPFPEIVQSDRYVFVSDMSGFTKLTKQYGILHYLRLVLCFRGVVEDCLQNLDGEVVKYEGDNVIATFSSCQDAIVFTHSVMEQVDEYNEGRSKDFQMQVKFGLSKGEVLLGPHMIFGSAFRSCYKLAEDIGEVRNILVTQDFKDGIDVCSSHSIKTSHKLMDADSGAYYEMSIAKSP